MDQAVLPVNTAATDAGHALAEADLRLAAGTDALERLVVLGPSRLLDDETVARVRALIGDLAAQLAGPEYTLAGPVAAMLAGNRTVLTYCHALAVEWHMATTVAARLAIDPVLPPLVQSHAATTMDLIAAQARWFEAMRRMRLVPGDLPADLYNLAHAMVCAARVDHAIAGGAETRQGLDQGPGRLVLLHQAVAGLGEDLDRALRVDEAGVSLFFTALAIASGHARETVVLAAAEDDPVRLSLLLCVAGLSRDDAARALLALRPDATLQETTHGAFAAEAFLSVSR